MCTLPAIPNGLKKDIIAEYHNTILLYLSDNRLQLPPLSGMFDGTSTDIGFSFCDTDAISFRDLYYLPYYSWRSQIQILRLENHLHPQFI